MKTNIYRIISDELKKHQIEDAEFEAKVIIGHFGNCSVSEAFFKNVDDFSQDTISMFKNAVERRVSGEPIQYIIGEWDFMDYTFKVGEGVLIPRPETELLCEYVIDKIKHLENPIVFDLCAGSGCIGLSVKKKVPQCEIYLVEKSSSALSYLRENAYNVCHGMFLTIIKGDIFDIDSFENYPKADVIVSNPPYIKSEDLTDLQKEVKFEPDMALDGGKDGLKFYRQITDEWQKFLNEDGFMAFECGEDQAEDISAMFKKNKFDSEVIEDYNHIKRFVIGRRSKHDF